MRFSRVFLGVRHSPSKGDGAYGSQILGTQVGPKVSYIIKNKQYMSGFVTMYVVLVVILLKLVFIIFVNANTQTRVVRRRKPCSRNTDGFYVETAGKWIAEVLRNREHDASQES